MTLGNRGREPFEEKGGSKRLRRGGKRIETMS